MRTNKFLEKGNQDGFTLPEIAAYVIFAGLLFSAGLMLYKAHNSYSLYEENKTRLEKSKLALQDFYTSEGRYPCPASRTAAPGDANYGVEQCRSQADRDNNPNSCVGVPTGIECTTDFTRDADADGNDDVVLIGAFPFTTVFDVLNPVNNPDKKARDFSHKDGTDAYGFHFTYAGGEIIMDDKYSAQNPAPADIMGSFFYVDESNASLSAQEGVGPVIIIAHNEGGYGAYTTWGVLHKACDYDSISSDITNILASDNTNGLADSVSETPSVKSSPLLATPASSHIFTVFSGGEFSEGDGNFNGFDPTGKVPGSTQTGTEEMENCDGEGIFQGGAISHALDLSFFNDLTQVVPPPVENFWTVVGLAPAPGSGQIVANKNKTGFVGINTNQPQFDLSVDGHIQAGESIIGTEICQNTDLLTCLEPRHIAGERPADNSSPEPHESAIRCNNNQVLYGIGGEQPLCVDLDLVTATNTPASASVPSTNVYLLDQATGTLSDVYGTNGACPPGTGIRAISNQRVICTAVQGVTF